MHQPGAAHRAGDSWKFPSPEDGKPFEAERVVPERVYRALAGLLKSTFRIPGVSTHAATKRGAPLVIGATPTDPNPDRVRTKQRRLEAIRFAAVRLDAIKAHVTEPDRVRLRRRR